MISSGLRCRFVVGDNVLMSRSMSEKVNASVSINVTKHLAFSRAAATLNPSASANRARSPWSMTSRHRINSLRSFEV